MNDDTETNYTKLNSEKTNHGWKDAASSSSKKRVTNLISLG